jgi:hypothetical protein
MDSLNSSSSIDIIKIIHNLSHNKYKIPIETLKGLLAIYDPKKNTDLEKEILIAKTITNNYHSYQIYGDDKI